MDDYMLHKRTFTTEEIVQLDLRLRIAATIFDAQGNTDDFAITHALNDYIVGELRTEGIIP